MANMARATIHDHYDHFSRLHIAWKLCAGGRRRLFRERGRQQEHDDYRPLDFLNPLSAANYSANCCLRHIEAVCDSGLANLSTHIERADLPHFFPR